MSAALELETTRAEQEAEGRPLVENEEGDLGVGGYSRDGRLGGVFTTNSRGVVDGELVEGEGFMGDMLLPPPVLPTPLPPVSSRDRVSLAAATSATPYRTGSSHPRTRFTSTLTSSPRSYDIPLRPILIPTTPSAPLQDEELPPAHQHLHDLDRATSPPSSPVFAPREDDKPHPERTKQEERTPHPNLHSNNHQQEPPC